MQGDAAGGFESKQIHIQQQQRNGRKSVTTISGLDLRLDFERLLHEFKTRWGCNGAVHYVREMDPTTRKQVTKEAHIQLQGDQRENLRNFLITEELALDDQIKVSGF